MSVLGLEIAEGKIRLFCLNLDITFCVSKLCWWFLGLGKLIDDWNYGIEWVHCPSAVSIVGIATS